VLLNQSVEKKRYLVQEKNKRDETKRNETTRGSRVRAGISSFSKEDILLGGFGLGDIRGKKDERRRRDGLLLC